MTCLAAEVAGQWFYLILDLYGPDTIHGDTQAQSGSVFGLSYVVGINLMPRIRNIKDLVLYKADRRRKYKHIDSLCRQSIDWALIERHYLDMMLVAVSIKAGRMTPSTILRRLGSESTKNKRTSSTSRFGNWGA